MSNTKMKPHPKAGSTGTGRASSMSTDMGSGTVAGNVRDGNDAAWNKTMKTGHGVAKEGKAHAGFLGAPGSNGSTPGYSQVSAGSSIGVPTGAGGKNGTAISSAALLPGMLTAKMGGAVTYKPATDMKKGHGQGAKTGLMSKGFL